MSVVQGPETPARADGETSSLSVLCRKAAAGRPATDEFVMTPAKALAQAVARAGQTVKLPVAIHNLTDARMTLGELIEVLEDRALLAIVEGPEEGLGLVALSPALLASLIEVQTTGRVSRQDPIARRPTRTDAAMCADLIDTILREFEDALDPLHDRTWSYGFRYASFLTEPRPLGLLLEETRYRVFRAMLDLGQGVRQADLLLALPADGRATAPRNVAVPQDGGDTGWEGFEKAVLSAPAQMDAVLHRMVMPLAEVMDLRPGQVISLPEDRLTQVSLEGAGRMAAPATGRLGQLRGYRAIRLDLGGLERRLSGAARDADHGKPDVAPEAQPTSGPPSAQNRRTARHADTAPEATGISRVDG